MKEIDSIEHDFRVRGHHDEQRMAFILKIVLGSIPSDLLWDDETHPYDPESD